MSLNIQPCLYSVRRSITKFDLFNIFILFSSLLLLLSCSSTVNKSNDFLSVVIENRTTKQIVTDLATIVKNSGYSLLSQSENEAVFETQPDQDSVIYYVRSEKYYKNYRNDYDDGDYRNRTLKLPHFEMVFNFTKVNTGGNSGILVESKVEYIAWEHKDDMNRNNVEGVEVQQILNELKANSQIDITNTGYKTFKSIHHLLKYKISTHEAKSYKRKNYIRKVELSTVDYNRQVQAMIYVKEELKNYCDYIGGIFEEENDNIFYSSNGIVIPNAYYNSFNEANVKKAFGIKSCMLEEGVIWRLMIKPKLVDPEVKSETVENKKTEINVSRFKNPELFLYIQMLLKELPTYMKDES